MHPTGWPHRRAATSAAAAVLAAAALLGGAACSPPAAPQDSLVEKPLATASSGSARPTTSAPVSRKYPLTSRTGATAATATRPVVAVPVSAGIGRPTPTGLDLADVVFVTFPASGQQRALALYQSRDATRVGPVTETRPVDGKMLAVLRANLAYAGGAPRFVDQLAAAGVPQWSALVHPSSFSRDAYGRLYAATAPARAATGARPAREGLLTFEPLKPGAALPRPVTIAMPGQPTVRLTYDRASGTWNGTLGQIRVRATNVLVQTVTYERLVLPHSGQRTELDPAVIGQGSATSLVGPSVLPGTWNRRSREHVTSFVTAAKNLVTLAPGTTWTIVAPLGTRVSN
jgi:hypothetical protein